jgi:hypothetical protein
VVPSPGEGNEGNDGVFVLILATKMVIYWDFMEKGYNADISPPITN